MGTAERDEVHEPTAHEPTAHEPTAQTLTGRGNPLAGRLSAVRAPRRRLLIATIAAGATLVVATTAGAKVLYPDLAVMPPIIRDPAFPATADPSEPAAWTLTPPASSVASPTSSPSPSPTGSGAAPVSQAARAPSERRLLLSAEAEAAQRRGGNVRSVTGASGGKVVEGLDRSGDYVQFAVTLRAAGHYTVLFHYICGSAGRSALIRVNSGRLTSVNFSPTGTWQTVRSLALPLDLAAGENTIMFAAAASPAPDLDRITIEG